MDLSGHTGYQLRLPCAGFDLPIEGIDPRLLEPTACGKGATWKKTSKMKKGRPMRKTICSATAAILMVAAIPVEAGAFPLATTGSGNADSPLSREVVDRPSTGAPMADACATTGARVLTPTAGIGAGSARRPGVRGACAASETQAEKKNHRFMLRWRLSSAECKAPPFPAVRLALPNHHECLNFKPPAVPAASSACRCLQKRQDFSFWPLGKATPTV